MAIQSFPVPESFRFDLSPPLNQPPWSPNFHPPAAGSWSAKGITLPPLREHLLNGHDESLVTWWRCDDLKMGLVTKLSSSHFCYLCVSKLPGELAKFTNHAIMLLNLASPRIAYPSYSERYGGDLGPES